MSASEEEIKSLRDKLTSAEEEIAGIKRQLGGLLEIGVRLLEKDDGGWLLVNDRAEQAETTLAEMRWALEAIRDGTTTGKVGGDDVVWFDEITTLYDFCDGILARYQAKPAAKEGK